VFVSSQDFTDSPLDSRQVIAVMDSFKSKIIRLRVCTYLLTFDDDVYCQVY